MLLPVHLDFFSSDLMQFLNIVLQSIAISLLSPIQYCGFSRSVASHLAHSRLISNTALPHMQFTFASNAATIVGGCLVTNRYKLRLPAAFISAFVISVREEILNHHHPSTNSKARPLLHNFFRV